MIPPEWATRARTNWRSGVWVLVAILTFAVAIVVSRYARDGFAPSEPEKAARNFLGAWNVADYRRAYTNLDTPVAADVFVEAVTRTAAPLRDARVEQVVQQDADHALITYSATVPDALAAATGVVVANRLRYGASCVDANSRSSRYVRVTDTLPLQRGADGTWKVGFRGNSDFLQQGAGAIGLAYDLSPGHIAGKLNAVADARSSAYDDAAISASLAVYQKDVGSLPTDDPGTTTPDIVKLRVKGIAAVCGGVVPAPTA